MADPRTNYSFNSMELAIMANPKEQALAAMNRAVSQGYAIEKDFDITRVHYNISRIVSWLTGLDVVLSLSIMNSPLMRPLIAQEVAAQHPCLIVDDELRRLSWVEKPISEDYVWNITPNPHLISEEDADNHVAHARRESIRKKDGL
jgi:hypothetical protein